MKTSLLLIPVLALLAAVLIMVWPSVLSDIARKGHEALANHMVRQGLLLGMTTLAVNKARDYEIGEINELPMIANDIIYEGAAVGDNGSGLARPLVAADPFLGFAQRKADNTGGAASAVNVQIRQKGQIVLTVTGAASADDVGVTVYASDDDTFTLTSSGNTAIGKVMRWVSSTTCVVYFEGVQVRSI